MYSSVGPASDGVVRRVLPGLETVAMVEVVAWFPVIEDFVAVLDGREGGGDEIG